MCPTEPRAGNETGLTGPRNQHLNDPLRPSSSPAVCHCGPQVSHQAYFVQLLACLDQLPPVAHRPHPPDNTSVPPGVNPLGFLGAESSFQERENLIVPRAPSARPSLSAVARGVGVLAPASAGGGGWMTTGVRGPLEMEMSIAALLQPGGAPMALDLDSRN